MSDEVCWNDFDTQQDPQHAALTSALFAKESSAGSLLLMKISQETIANRNIAVSRMCNEKICN